MIYMFCGREFVYYEPVKDKLYVSCHYSGETPRTIMTDSVGKDDQQLITTWHLSDPEWMFYFMCEL